MPVCETSILLAVDASEVYVAVKRALVEAGYRVHGARDGNDAAGIAARFLPPIVITTPDLPHVRGPELIEVARRARSPLPLAALFLVAPTDSRPLPSAPLVRALRLPVGASALTEAVGGLAADLEDTTIERHANGGESVEAGPRPAQGRSSTRGRLSSRSLASILLALMKRGFTGNLTLRAGEVEKKIQLLHGRPVNCETNLSTETAGELLLREKLVSARDLEAAREHMASSDLSETEALVADGVLDRSALAAAMQRHVRERIVTAFSWDDAEWELVETSREAIHPLASGLEPLWLVLEGTRRYTPPRALLDFFDSNQERYVHPTDELDLHSAALQAVVGGSRVAEGLDGRSRLSELQAATGLDELLFTQLMIALHASGLISLEEAPLEEAAKGSWSRSVELIGASPSGREELSGAAPEAERRWSDEIEQPEHRIRETDPTLRDDVLGVYTRMGDADPFDLLEVEPQVDAAGLARSFADWAARVGPDRMGEIHDPKLARLAGQVWLRLEEAYEALSDEEGRKRWKAERRRRREGRGESKVRWLDADKAFRAGRAHLASGNEVAALEAFRAAESMNRKDPVYRLHSAWAEWLIARDAGDEQAMLAAEAKAGKAVEAIPILEEGWVFLGEMAMRRKDLQAARAHLEKALLFNPGSETAERALARLEKL